MGVDVEGWIEIKDNFDEKWVGAVKIGWHLIHGDRNYPMDTLLFGFHFKYENALAARRGLPDDVSEETKQSALMYQGRSHSWIMWDELEKLKWQERTIHAEAETRKEVYLTTDTEFEVIMSPGWELIFSLMRTLSEYHGANCVRLIVWFN